MNNNLKSILKVYSSCAVAASYRLKRNWIIIPASLALLLLFTTAFSLIGATGTGIAGGFLAGLLQILALTLYFSWLQETIDQSTLTIREMARFDYPLFSAIINVGFILFIAQFLLAGFAQAIPTIPVLPLFALTTIIIFNPIAEVILDSRANGLESFTTAYAFIIENWIEWFIPFIIVLLPWILISPLGPLSALSQTNPLLPASPLVFGTETVGIHFLGKGAAIPSLFIGLALANWFMIFRSLLYRELNSRPRRRRGF